jgi:hypothetical protein
MERYLRASSSQSQKVLWPIFVGLVEMVAADMQGGFEASRVRRLPVDDRDVRGSTLRPESPEHRSVAANVFTKTGG